MAKTEQIIIRLSPDKKDKLQKIADRLDMSMSDLIREKIDEVISYYENKKINDEREAFLKEKNLGDAIFDDKMVEKLKEEFIKSFIAKMQRDIEEVNLTQFAKLDKE